MRGLLLGVWWLMLVGAPVLAGQATLPSELKADGPMGDLADMPVGDFGYMHCWALDADINNQMWMDGSSSVWRTQDYGSSIKVTREESGVVADLSFHCCRVIPEEMSKYKLERMLPVIRLEGAEHCDGAKKRLKRWLGWGDSK